MSAETLWDGGWLLRQLLPYSEAEFNRKHLKMLNVCFFEDFLFFFWFDTVSLSPVLTIYQFPADGRFRMRNAQVHLSGKLKVPGLIYSSGYCLMSGKSAKEASKEENVGYVGF